MNASFEAFQQSLGENDRDPRVYGVSFMQQAWPGSHQSLGYKRNYVFLETEKIRFLADLLLICPRQGDFTKTKKGMI